VKIFIILNTPPSELSEKTLSSEVKEEKLRKAIPSDLSITFLKRTGSDTAAIARRIQNITFLELGATIQGYWTRGAEKFASLSEAGDRVIVLNPNGRDWEQYIVA